MSRTGPDLDESLLGKKGAILRNFMVMSVCFSANHGTVTALIALASSSLGESLGNVSSGLLYLVYTLTAGFASHGLLTVLGTKRTLVVGLAIYCAYVVSYLIAFAMPSVRWYAVVAGAALGGVAAGSIWPAQGAYYSRSADLYAKATGLPRESANSTLGGYFAAVYLVLEVTMKLLSSIVPAYVPKGTEALFALFSSIAFVSVLGVASVDPLDAEDVSTSKVDFGAKALSAVRLLFNNPLCACMLPMNFAFGFGAAYLNGYFNSQVVKVGVGTNAIGYVSSIVVGTAASSALAYGELGRRLGDQSFIVAWGTVCFGIFALANLLFSASRLGHWLPLVALAMCFGAGRGVWESAFKATFADYFPDDIAAAFASCQLQSGLASTIGFFIIPHVPPDLVGSVALVFALLALLCTLLARSIHHRRSSASNATYEPAASQENPVHNTA